MRSRKHKKNNQAMLIAGIAAALVVVIVVAVCLISASSRNRKYETLYQNAERSYIAQQYDYALQYANEALQIRKLSDKKCEALYLLMADAYEGKGDLEGAKNILYQGYMELGTEALQQRLQQLNGEAGAGELQFGSVRVKTTAVSAVLSDMGLKSADIAELKQLTKLQTLTLSQNQIDDISALSGLTELSYLQLADNKIKDLTPLKNLSKLKSLFLDGNPIEDFTPLFSLKGLTTLSLNNITLSAEQLKQIKDALPNCEITNEMEAPKEVKLGSKTVSVDETNVSLANEGLTDIKDISWLTKMEILDLSGNSVRDLTPLNKAITLKQLNLRGNGASNISALSVLVNLTYLDLRGNSVTDLTPVSGMEKLEELYLDDNRPMTLSPLTNMPALKILSLQNCSLKDADLEYLKNLNKLEKLYLDGNKNITGSALLALEEAMPDCSISAPDIERSVKWGGTEYTMDSTSITATNCGITDIGVLKSFTKLEFLDLSGNKIAEAEPISQLTSLKELSLAGNRLTTVKQLQNLRNLESLDVSDNEDITLMSYLSGLTKLTYLDVSGNEGITDMSPLYNLTRLRTLDVSNTGIEWEDVEALRQHLPDCDVRTDLAAPTPTPAPTATPAPTPAPTPEPTPAPTPEPVYDSDGNLVVD